MSKKPKEKAPPQKRFSDLVGIDCSTTATKVVRLKKNKSEITLLGIDILPAVDFGSTSRRMELPRNINAFYGCLAYSGPNAVVRMVNAPLAAEEHALPESKLRELLNVEESFRVSSSLIKRGSGRQDSSFLAAGMPQEDVRFLLSMFPSGPPAAASVEVAGLAFVSAFLNARGATHANEAVCLLDAGELTSYFVFLNKGAVALVGKLAFGARTIRERLAKDLGVDEELASTILSDRSIDISSSIISVLEPYLKQLSISRDFVERHQGCRISKVYVSGGLSLMPKWPEEVGQLLNSPVERWSPLENIQYDEDVVPEHLEEQLTRFSAAIGAAIGGFEAS